MQPDLVFYSSRSGNTARFVARLGGTSLRIPIAQEDPMPETDRPFVLICPTYADAHGDGAVPKQVIRFLNDPQRRAKLLGVIAAGNRNFGATFALGGKIIAEKCKVPVLYRFELAGTDHGCRACQARSDASWIGKTGDKHTCLTKQLTGHWIITR